MFAVNRALVEEWAPESTGTLLKTDAFDEACSEGLSGVLESRATTVVYMDVSFWVLLSARRLLGMSSLVCCDIRQLPFATGSLGVGRTMDDFSESLSKL